jgi:hypothetical protein
MAREKTKLTVPETAEPASPTERHSQTKAAPSARFQLQIDRQTKRYFATSEEAEEAGLIIKKAHPLVQVAVYDPVESQNKLIVLPTE